jgi:hypothetical protein
VKKTFIFSLTQKPEIPYILDMTTDKWKQRVREELATLEGAVRNEQWAKAADASERIAHHARVIAIEESAGVDGVVSKDGGAK